MNHQKSNEIFELHSYYSKLFEAFAILPLGDIGSALFEEAVNAWSTSWSDFGAFLQRLEAYLSASTISEVKKSKILAFIEKQTGHYKQHLWAPEDRPSINDQDETDLQARHWLLAAGGYTDTDRARWKEEEIAGHTIDHAEDIKNRLQEVERRLKIIADRRTPVSDRLESYRYAEDSSLHVLLQTTDGIHVQEFTREHAYRLLSYPNTVWVKASPDAVVTSSIPDTAAIPIDCSSCHCQQKLDAEHQEDLCANCPIITMLQDPQATAHVRAEMRTFQELKLPEQYQKYCAERLDHHANLAARLANEMNQRGGWSFKKMEAKFYNKSIAKLYRDALTTVVKTEDAGPSEASSLVIEQLRTYLSQVPVFLNDAHQIDLPVECGGYDEQDEEFRPLLRAFGTALVRNPPKKSQRRQMLGEMLNICNLTIDNVKQKRASFEAGDYSLNFLAADYPMFHFGEIETAKAHQASPLFWSFFTTWVHYRVLFAREVYNLLADSLGEPRLSISTLKKEVFETEITPTVDAADKYAPPSTPYFHLEASAIARQKKMRNEARDAGYRQALITNIRKRLTDGNKPQLINFLEGKRKLSNIKELSSWLEDQLWLLKSELSEADILQLNQDIRTTASEIENILPYSDGFGDYFIKNLQKEPLNKVADYLHFMCTFGMPGTAGFFVLNQAEDAAYLRDIITEHLRVNPKGDHTILCRAVDWLTAQIKLLSIPNPPKGNPADDVRRTEISVSPTVADLCRSPFTPADLNALLCSLGVLDSSGNCLTNKLRGKAQSKRSRFTAAYRVLQRRGLMEATANDIEWATALKIAYGVELGDTARGYILTHHGNAPDSSSNDFQVGVKETKEWIEEWQEGKTLS